MSGKRGLHAGERAGEVHGDDAVPRLGRDVEHGVERLDARAGDEDLDGAELARGRARTPASTDARSATSTSTATTVRAAVPQLGGRLCRRRAVAVEDRDAVTVGDELPGHAEPDAGRAAGDDGDPAHQAASIGSNSRCSFVRPRRIHVGS